MDPTNPFLASTAMGGGNMQPGAIPAPAQPGPTAPTVITPQQLAMHPAFAANPFIQGLMQQYGGQIAPMIQAIQTAHPQMFQHFMQSPWAGKLQQFMPQQPQPGQGPIMQPMHQDGYRVQPAPMQPMGVAPTGVMPTNPAAGQTPVAGIARQPGAPGFGL